MSETENIQPEDNRPETILDAFRHRAITATFMPPTLIYMVMVVALSIFVSNSGVISFGHVTFALIGASV